MIRQPPRSTRTDTLLPYTTLFRSRYDLDKIGKPTDRYEWHMTPQTVNAYYSSGTNTINFPAAILQPPFFYADGDDAINYGGIGAVIGHEAGHRSEERRVGKDCVRT